MFVVQEYESSFFWNLEHVLEFRTSFGNESKLKFTNGRIYDDLKLSNKGKMKKAKAEFHHRKAGDSSGKFKKEIQSSSHVRNQNHSPIIFNPI